MNFREKLEKQILVIDGAMGTELIRKGIAPGSSPEELNLKNPTLIASIHQAYVDAGADIIETNTFGGSRLKLQEFGLASKVKEINTAAVKLAKKAAGSKAFVAASMGPLGTLLEPMGEFTFDQAFETFSEQAAILEKAGADLVSIETMSDLQEARAAVLAVKEKTNLPIIVHLTYEDKGRTVTGTPPEVAAVTFEALGVDVVGANCSGGPKELEKVVKEYARSTNRWLSFMPNAGLPQLDSQGRAVYKMTPQEFARWAKKFVDLGANIVGGCCGTGPAHIRAVAEVVKAKNPRVRSYSFPLRFASRTRVVEVNPQKLFVIGERINPAGKKDFQEELKEGKTSYIRRMAQEQAKAGANLLDINISLVDIDETKAMKEAVLNAAAVSDLPFSIDTANAKALEEGLKNFPGKPLINSTTASEKSLNKILPLAKKYGAAIIGLTFDEKGIPETAEDKYKIAQRVIKKALEIGIPHEDIFIDTLVMSVGVNKEAPLITLEAAKKVNQELKIKTILGISNVSHGLPNRREINKTYLYMALQNKVSAAIIDPLDPETMQIAQGVKKPKVTDICKIDLLPKEKEIVVAPKPAEVTPQTVLKEIKSVIINGDAEMAVSYVKKALTFGHDPNEILYKGLVGGIEFVGDKFSRGEYFLPQVVAAAKAMQDGFQVVEGILKSKGMKKMGTVVLATVQGDIHDIGKNIVALLLKNYGFAVIDLGKNVAAKGIVVAAKKHKADVVALSALLTTTVPEMKAVKEALARENLNIPVMVGGAAVTPGFAQKIAAHFGRDAVEAVKVAKELVGK